MASFFKQKVPQNVHFAKSDFDNSKAKINGPSSWFESAVV